MRSVLLALALMLGTSGMALAQGAGAPAPLAAAPLQIGIEVPGAVPAETGPLSVLVVPSIVNRGTTPAHLAAPSPCDVRAWTLKDQSGEIVAASPSAICAQVVADHTLAAGETLDAPELIVIPKGLEPGQTYRLDYRFWGLATAARIVPVPR